jgi:hypothetical protein
MDLWTFHRYQQPRLCVDAIDHPGSSPIIELRSGNQTYRLAFDDVDAARQFGAELTTLSDSNAPLWSTLRESPTGSSWHALGTFLDTRSLIHEARDDAAESLGSQAKRIEDCIEGTITAVMTGVDGDRRSRAAAHSARLRRELAVVASSATVFGEHADPFDAAIQANFFLGLLAVEFEYFRRFSPLTLVAVDSLLGRIAGESGCRLDLAENPVLSEACGLYDMHDLESHLWLVAKCVVSSTSEDATRFATPGFPTVSLCSGLEFMRRTELLTRETLVGWGANPYVTALDALNDSWSPLVAGPFIEQYHVTRRFVEIVAPLLSRRLSAPLRSMMFRYFSEEVGHEALESTTCEALGVSPRALERAIPLPLHFGFVDALTLVADVDPIASFAAIMVIEGIFGEPPKMSLRLAAVARKNPAFRAISGDHDELNETLNHNSISRDAFEHVTAVSPATQLRVMRRILFLLELNHRAWHGIAEFYGQQNELRLQGSFGQKLMPHD